MKNLIVQFYDQKPFPKWASIAKSRFEKYAQTFDAEYLFYDKADDGTAQKSEHDIMMEFKELFQGV